MNSRCRPLRCSPVFAVAAFLVMVAVLAIGGCPPTDPMPPSDGGDPTSPGGDSSTPGGDSSGEGVLTGTWAGEMVYNLATTWDGEVLGDNFRSQVTRPTTVTFDKAGKPDVLTIYVLENLAVDVPTAGLAGPQDQAQIAVGAGADTLTVTLKSLTVSQSSSEIVLDTECVQSGEVWTGTYTFVATKQADGRLDCRVNANISAGDVIAIGLTTVGEGLLSQ